jgi:hypothetical protein
MGNLFWQKIWAGHGTVLLQRSSASAAKSSDFAKDSRRRYGSKKNLCNVKNPHTGCSKKICIKSPLLLEKTKKRNPINSKTEHHLKQPRALVVALQIAICSTFVSEYHPRLDVAPPSA